MAEKIANIKIQYITQWIYNSNIMCLKCLTYKHNMYNKNLFFVFKLSTKNHLNTFHIS